MTGRRLFLLAAALLEWFALITQFILMMASQSAPTIELLCRFFTFFTITTNLLVGIYLLALLIRPSNHFFTRPSTQTAIVMYITVVGLVYNAVLRGIWPSSPLQTLIHEILHTAIPLMMILYWAAWVDARSLQRRSIWRWLLYPAIYTIIIFARGSFANWYPYPFLDLRLLTTPAVIRNCAIVLFVFLLFSWIYYFVGKRKATFLAKKNE